MEFHHVLNRGVDKRTIFLDEKDYVRFIHNLFVFNDKKNVDPNSGYHHRRSQLPEEEDRSTNTEYRDVGRPYIRERERKERELLVHIHAFCLMSNHYHLLLSPAIEDGIPLFMKKLNGGYAKYFNERYERSGALFQGKYKSVPIENDRHFMFIPFYIHFNPLDLKMKEWRESKLKNVHTALSHLEKYRWSSHLDYSNKRNFPSLTQREFFTHYFEEQGGYQKLVVENLKNFQRELENIEDVTLE